MVSVGVEDCSRPTSAPLVLTTLPPVLDKSKPGKDVNKTSKSNNWYHCAVGYRSNGNLHSQSSQTQSCTRTRIRWYQTHRAKSLSETAHSSASQPTCIVSALLLVLLLLLPYCAHPAPLF